MRYRLSKGDAFPIAEVLLSRGEKIRIERGAMVYHNCEVELEGKMNSNSSGLGGVVKAIGRSAVSGESMFVTTVTGLTDNGTIGIAPGAPGHIKELAIGAEQWRINDSAFLACDDSVTYEMKRQKLGKAIFGKTGGLFVMETKGVGTMLVNTYGDIMEFDLDGSKPFVVDNDHVIAWSASLDYQIKVASGTFGFTSGEGVVNEFHGRGKILVQTRNVSSLARMLAPFIQSGS
ncbi:TIGR00266 family protein [Lachnospiraceae bacterium OttesenSCG-928-E19]|nr:TIGR00266 family protein [Lachnospiraceae bacterium OttesenSCG-928-E19]